ncbi:GNAT family N-acetyltransferase [Enterococcus sp. AZ103]|uniref:GNAT family N-acetyltransferase n=1 Tax=Enterococcus sp. AZ103 TaxID=2774628 RepID=UPI003F2602CB
MNLTIREASEQDRENIYQVQYQAFNEMNEADLADNILQDPLAETISLLAFDSEEAVGHILFSRAKIANAKMPASLMILAPLAIIPAYQKMGIGGQLIEAGLTILQKKKIDLVFVLGHIDYYPRHGFKSALAQGFIPPYPTEKGQEDAWMFQPLSSINLTDITGKIIPTKTLDQLEYW